MGESSWLKSEASITTYRFPNGALWTVQHEYQPETCPHCGEQQYCRLTHVWVVDPGGQPRPPISHINRGVDLRALKQVAVQCMQVGDREVPAREIQTAEGWALEADGAVIATQVPE